MLKRPASRRGTGRKKKKGNATYEISSIDSSDDEKMDIEDVRAWDISTSVNTGRMNARRKTLKHYSEMLPPEVPSASQEPGRVEAASVEDTGSLADTETSRKTTKKQRPKRKRVRTVKENDSVSESLVFSSLGLTGVFRQGWRNGFSIVRSF